MRYVAPAREVLDSKVFECLPLSAWHDHAELFAGSQWPTVDALNARLSPSMRERFVAQTPALLADGLHYEQRIAEAGLIATRENNWHDLFNALVWLRYAPVKRALNARQMVEIGTMGPKTRSRAQYALTHFDEAGVMVMLRDPALLELWNAHDWYALFWTHRDAWRDGSIRIELFGHALMELALTPGKLLVGKALVFLSKNMDASADLPALAAEAITHGHALTDPLELRPLPLSGIPGWHPDNDEESFHRETICYQPKREGREYPTPMCV